MDVVGFLVRTRCLIVLNEYFSVNINEEAFRIKMIKDSHAPLRIIVKQNDLQ